MNFYFFAILLYIITVIFFIILHIAVGIELSNRNLYKFALFTIFIISVGLTIMLYDTYLINDTIGTYLILIIFILYICILLLD